MHQYLTSLNQSLRIAVIGLGTFLLVITAISLHINQKEVATAAQPDDEWSITFWDVATHELTRVDIDGTTQSYDLGENVAEAFEREFAVAADGSLAAYCVVPTVDDSGESVIPNVTLYIYDLTSESTRFEIDLGVSDGCRLGQYSFSADGAMLGVGLISPHHNVSPINWRLPIVDTATGNIVRELTANDDIALNREDLFGESSYFMPEMRNLSSNEAVFVRIPWRTDSGGSADAVRWNWEEDTLTHEPNLGAGTLISTTGELIWTDVDETRPLAVPAAPIPKRNVIRVRDADGEERTVFFVGDQVIVNAIIINGGREIAMELYDGYREDDPRQESHWVALDRAGNIRELPHEAEGYVRIYGTSNGYVYISSIVDGVALMIAYENGEERLLWELGDSFKPVVGITPMTIAEDLSPFVGIE